MLQNVQNSGMEWNITPSQSTFTFCLIKLLPAIQSNNTSTTHNQTTFSLGLSVSIVIFHTAHRATGSGSLHGSLLEAIPNFNLSLLEAGIINTTQYTATHTRALARCHGQTHTRAQAHTRTGARAHTHTHTRARKHLRAGTHKQTRARAAHTHPKRGKGNWDRSYVAGEGVTKCAASGPFGTFCHHVVTKCAAVTKRAGSASNLIRFVTLVTKRAVVTKGAATELRCKSRGGRPAVPAPSSPHGLSGRNLN